MFDVCRVFARGKQHGQWSLAARQRADGRWTAGGLIVQQLARSEEGGMRLHVEGANPDWEHVAVLGGSVTEDELTDLDLSEESLLWRLFNEEEVRVLPAETLKRGMYMSIRMRSGR